MRAVRGRYTFDQRELARDEGWYEEKRPQSLVVWRGLPPDELPVHLHTKEHYLLDSSPTNPALRAYENAGAAGFDPSLLPDLPDSSRIRSADSDGVMRRAGAPSRSVSGD